MSGLVMNPGSSDRTSGCVRGLPMPLSGPIMNPGSFDQTSRCAHGLPILISSLVVSLCSSALASRSPVGQTHGHRGRTQ
eukprot:15477026-Alexandrium_andersonii.AAC.1